MERLGSEHFDKQNISFLEHRHRYLWAAAYVRGVVCDIACGAGYGSELLLANDKVISYLGMDVSDEALSLACKRYSGDRIKFLKASATDIPKENESVDSIISMETLEHLENPALAIKEFSRVLRPGGILLGSVPSKIFEEKCEFCYGPNEHHIQRFTLDGIREILGKEFTAVKLGVSMVGIGTMLYPEPREGNFTEEKSKVWIPHSNSILDGSIHFAASDSNDRLQSVFSEVLCWHGMSFIDYQTTEVAPLRKAYATCEDLVYLKDRHLNEAAELLKNRDSEIRRLNMFNPIYWMKKLFRKF